MTSDENDWLWLSGCMDYIIYSEETSLEDFDNILEIIQLCYWEVQFAFKPNKQQENLARRQER